MGLEVVAEPRSTRAEFSRRAGGREISSEEMLIAYRELEREMNELRNNIGRKTYSSDTGILSAWREHVETSRAEAYGDLETRAAILADAAERGRERRYDGARVIEVAPIRETPANANATDAPEGRSSTVTHKNTGGETEQAEKSRVRTKSIKKEKVSDNKKIKLEKRKKTETREDDAEVRTKNKKKSKTKLRKTSTLTESSEEEEDAPQRGIFAGRLNIRVATLKKMRKTLGKTRKIKRVKIRIKR